MNTQANRGVTVIGLLIFIIIISVTLCGALHLKKKAVAAGNQIKEKRDAALDEAMGEEEVEHVAKSAPLTDLFIESPLAVWTHLTNDWYLVDIPDEEYNRLQSEHQEWVLLYSYGPAGPWKPSMNRQWGNEEYISQLRWEWANAEGPMAMNAAHGPPRTEELGVISQSLYWIAIPANVYVPEDPEDPK